MKYHKHQLTKHHRKPTSIGGTSSDKNISHVPRNQHGAWHLLFSNHTAPTIASIITEKWLDPDYVMVAIPKKKYEDLKKHEVL